MASDREFASVAIIDTATHSVAAWLEVLLPRAKARSIMEREPAVDEDKLLSWGQLRISEVRRLIDAQELEDSERADEHAWLDELLLPLAGRSLMFSFHFHRGR